MNKKWILLILFILCIFFNSNVQAYNFGDEVTFSNVNFYVLEDKGEVVTLFVKDPLSTIDINYFGYGHVNWYNKYEYGYPAKEYTKRALNANGYGLVAFYSSKNCNNIYDDYSECTNDYKRSDLKYIVDAWAKRTFDKDSIAIDDTGYKARLMNKQEIDKYYIYEYRETSPSDSTIIRALSNDTPDWLKNSKFWIMDAADDKDKVYDNFLASKNVYDTNYIRPIINVYKSALDNDDNTIKEYNLKDEDFIKLSNNYYKTGEIVVYGGEKFYVLNDTSENSKGVSLIRTTLLSVDEVNQCNKNYINKNTELPNEAVNINNYGAVAYYSSDTCKKVQDSDIKYGCTVEYDKSDIKHIVDEWSSNIFDLSNPNFSNLDMKFRIIDKSDLLDVLGYNEVNGPYGTSYDLLDEPPKEVSTLDLSYCWSSILHDDSNYLVRVANAKSTFMGTEVYNPSGVVCPVIQLKKNPVIIDELEETMNSNDNLIVNVADTRLFKIIVIPLIGILFALAAIFLIIYIIKKHKAKEK